MNGIPMEHGLLLAAVLFSLGVIGLLSRRNVLFLLMSLEIMFNAAGLAFIVGGARWVRADGQVMFFFILAVAAAELCVGLALTVQFFRTRNTLDSDLASEMGG